MDVLIRFGFTIEEIQNMMDTNDEITSISDTDVLLLIDYLQNIGFPDKVIKNIFITNPFCLNRKVKDIKLFFKRLEELSDMPLYMLFDSNPYLLNISLDKFNELYKKKEKEGYSVSEIFFYISSNIVY